MSLLRRLPYQGMKRTKIKVKSFSNQSPSQSTSDDGTNAVDFDFPPVVSVIGSGSFGSAMARIIGESASNFDKKKPPRVNLYARRQSVADEINLKGTNAQYLPPPSNDRRTFGKAVRATTDLTEAVRDASVVVLAVPSSYLGDFLDRLKLEGVLRPDAIVVSVMKGLHYDGRRIGTTTDEIKQKLPMHPSVALGGPNIYKEMLSNDDFAEATIGYDVEFQEHAKLVQRITSTPFFKTSLCPDRIGVELCGGFKNVIALATGFCDGVGLGANTRAAVIRTGMHEIANFMKKTGEGDPSTVFTTSAGVGDMILTCTAGRGRLLAKEFARDVIENGPLLDKQSNIERWETIENTLLNGMKLPDWHNAQEVHQALVDLKCEEEFPLLDAVYGIGFEGHNPKSIIDALARAVHLSGR